VGSGGGDGTGRAGVGAAAGDLGKAVGPGSGRVGPGRHVRPACCSAPGFPGVEGSRLWAPERGRACRAGRGRVARRAVTMAPRSAISGAGSRSSPGRPAIPHRVLA
jgi:hypothetical protein